MTNSKKIHNLPNNETGLHDYIFSIYDNVAQIFEPPFTEKNKGTAIRRIQDLIQNNTQSPYSKFPDNFVLYHIGYFDNSVAGILDLEPEQVIQFLELTENKE
tara:strand:+ start:98 stop:403 length:306 start_codon:yes stop_codon:yes gene_type:complete